MGENLMDHNARAVPPLLDLKRIKEEILTKAFNARPEREIVAKNDIMDFALNQHFNPVVRKKMTPADVIDVLQTFAELKSLQARISRDEVKEILDQYGPGRSEGPK